MDNKLKGKIFKILPMKEQLDDGKITNEAFEAYLTKTIIKFSGLEDIDEELKEEVLTIIKGIKATYRNLNQQDIKSSILRLTNMKEWG